MEIGTARRMSTPAEDKPPSNWSSCRVSLREKPSFFVSICETKLGITRGTFSVFSSVPVISVLADFALWLTKTSNSRTVQLTAHRHMRHDHALVMRVTDEDASNPPLLADIVWSMRPVRAEGHAETSSMAFATVGFTHIHTVGNAANTPGALLVPDSGPWPQA
jgi:hypothetical protein